MKNFIYLFLFCSSILTWSCDENEAFFENLNEGPGLTLKVGDKSGVLLSDSLKVSNNAAVFVKQLELSYNDENANIKSVSIRSVTDDVFVIQEDTILIGDNFVLTDKVSDSLKVELLSFENGFKQLEFRITDDFEKVSVATLELYVFRNLVPIVRHSVVREEENNLINFDLNKSYDPDSIFGGRIIQYELNWNGETLIKNDGNFTVLTSSTQTIYDYSVRVRDNNGDYSFIISDRINL